MPKYFKLPLLSPFRFTPVTDKPSVHFGGSWTCEQLKFYEMPARYVQKWARGDATKMQLESSLPPSDLTVYDVRSQEMVKTLAWVRVFQGTYYNIYELDFGVDDLPDGIYCLCQTVSFLTINWQAISEPFSLRDTWSDTLFFKYKNTYNDYDVAFNTGIQFGFRCEATIAAYAPDRDREAYVDQMHDVATLSGTPYFTQTLFVGESQRCVGVSPYIVDILNRIFVCDYILIEDVQYQSNVDSKWNIGSVKGYPLIVASLEVIRTGAMSSLEFTESDNTLPGIVVAYDIDTSLFGPGALVPITDIQQD